MALGYTRQAEGNIQPNLAINAEDINLELNDLQSAFDITLGHDHSGSSAGTGSKINLTTGITGILPIVNGGTGSSTNTTAGAPLLAAAYGVVADGVTSDDVALAAAIAAAIAVKGTLLLPPGKILLTGAAGTISLHDIRIIGAGGGISGTQILLTSLSVAPFSVGNHWAIEYLSFYWPNQNSGVLKVYPPLFTDNGVKFVLWSLDNVKIINAYDGFKQTTGGSGNWKISNCDLFAVNKLFSIGSSGDSMHLTACHFDPSAWIETDSSAGPTAALNAGILQNILWHIPVGALGVTPFIDNSITFGWRYFFKIDNGGLLASCVISGGWDGIGTMIDSTAGGNIANVLLTGGAHDFGTSPVYGATTTGIYTAFDLGAGTGALYLKDFVVGSCTGDFIRTAGQSVYLDSVETPVGLANDGSHYFGIHLTASNGTNLVVRNSTFSGETGSAVHHGIEVDVAISKLIIQDNHFIYFNDDVNLTLGGGLNVLGGNTSQNTQGAASVLLNGTGGLRYINNTWDKPPVPVASGTGASVSGNVNNGHVTVGTTNPTTSFTLTFPFTGINPALVITPSSQVTVWVTVSGSVWTISSSADIHGTQIFYNWLSS